MNSYELSRAWFDFSFENPHKIKPYHSAIYFFAIEHCNRLGWKKVFGFPTSMVLDAIGMKSYNSYKKYLDELADFGFIKIHEYSKNQYSSNIIELSFNDKALDKALDKAFIKHATKQYESTSESIDSIDKQLNNKQLNNEIKPLVSKFSFFNSLIELGAEKQLVSDWLKVRKTKKLTNTETAFESLKKEFEKANKPINDILRVCVTNSWGGFKASWDWNIDLSKKATTQEQQPIRRNLVTLKE